jgi:hypothetical protein
MPRLAALAILHAGDGNHSPSRTKDHPPSRTKDHPPSRTKDHPPSYKQGRGQITAPTHAADLIDRLRAIGVTLVYDPVTQALRTGTENAIPVSIS